MAGEPRFIRRMAGSAAVWVRAKMERLAVGGGVEDAKRAEVAQRGVS